MDLHGEKKTRSLKYIGYMGFTRESKRGERKKVGEPRKCKSKPKLKQNKKQKNDLKIFLSLINRHVSFLKVYIS